MLRKLIRILSVPFGAACGVGVVVFINEVFEQYDIILKQHISPPWIIALMVGVALISAVIAYILSNGFANWVITTMAKAEKYLSNVPIKDLTISTIGLIVGLVIAFLLGQAIATLDSPIISITANIVLYSILGVMGVRVARSRRDDLPHLFKRRGSKSDMDDEPGSFLLDSSIIIDGRITDIIKIGFLAGTFIIPDSVINELRRLADSEDELKHAKGRRGLEMLTTLQASEQISLNIVRDEAEGDMDTRLIKIAEQYSAILITNDYNLNKVAQVHGIKTLNLNDLANALKPSLIPGEDVQLMIVKDGKEPHQGIAYLEDGTMIVVEGGREYIGKQVNCVVTSVLQTSAGRLIFAKCKEQEKA